jgi:hypothetical protein
MIPRLQPRAISLRLLRLMDSCPLATRGLSIAQSSLFTWLCQSLLAWLVP